MLVLQVGVIGFKLLFYLIQKKKKIVLEKEN